MGQKYDMFTFMLCPLFLYGIHVLIPSALSTLKHFY